MVLRNYIPKMEERNLKNMKEYLTKMRISAAKKIWRARTKLAETSGEGYVDTAIKMGALLLAGLYALFNDTVLPTLVERVEEMFNYAG